jgi:hypothetical protein
LRLFFRSSTTLLLRDLIHFKIALWSDAERIRHAIEKGKHCRNVNSFSNLRLGPSVIAQLLHILFGGAIRRFRNLGDVIEQRAVRGAQACFLQIAIRDGLYGLFFCSLNTQEVCMRVQSIRAAIEPRYPARDRFLGLAVEMALGKVDCVAELHHFAQKVGAMAEALQNAGHLLAA